MMPCPSGCSDRDTRNFVAHEPLAANTGSEERGDATRHERGIPPCSFVLSYLWRLQGAGERGPPSVYLSLDLVPSALLSTGIMLLLSALDEFVLSYHGLTLLLPSFGASCTLAVCLTTATGAQPRTLLCTHLFAALLSLSLSHAMLPLPQPLGRLLSSTVVVSIITPLFDILGCVQPSSSATAVLAGLHDRDKLGDQGYLFLATPVLLGVTIIVIFAWLLNNLVPWRPPYPVWW
ncbi:hypothetical protein TRVL_09082 [Trypanosoma vivax]|uniref:HPP transmembrane region domain-containing protein n=1 Tax=Trypanosoma vivax (strain Y486) TaxID=1055687 RepID=G0U5P6_TRYVY|nr:hypothetical protein TRVL_09082 [Trypanosoma vivax]CCC51197.1 hypothetical protein TVY486_1002500 [Trypanosoma vivax Y486]